MDWDYVRSSGWVNKVPVWWMEFMLGDWLCCWVNIVPVWWMEFQLGEKSFSWVNGVPAGWIKLQFGEWSCSWVKGVSVGWINFQLGGGIFSWVNGVSVKWIEFQLGELSCNSLLISWNASNRFNRIVFSNSPVGFGRSWCRWQRRRCSRPRRTSAAGRSWYQT